MPLELVLALSRASRVSRSMGNGRSWLGAAMGDGLPFVVVELLVEHLYLAQLQLVDGFRAILEVDPLRLPSSGGSRWVSMYGGWGGEADAMLAELISCGLDGRAWFIFILYKNQ